MRGEGGGGRQEGQGDLGGEGHREGDGAKVGHNGRGCQKEGRAAEGRKGQWKAREVRGAKGRAEGWGTVDSVRTVAERGAEGGSARREAHGGRGTRDKGRRGRKEQEARDKGRWVEGGIWGRRCTGGRGVAGGGGVSSCRSPLRRTRRYCQCTPPPPPMYPVALPPAPVLQRPQAVRAARAAPTGKGEELRRAWERVGEEERRLSEREARVMGATAGVAGAQAHAQGTSGVGEAQAIEDV